MTRIRRTTGTLLSQLLVPAFILLGSTAAQGADLEEAEALLTAGRYDECIKVTSAEIEKNAYGEGWRILKAEAQLARGKYADALATVEAGIKRYSWSIKLRLLGYTAALHSDKTKRAGELIGEIDSLFARQSWRYSDAEDLVTLGQTALMVGADPREVLEGFFDRAKKNSPDEADGYLASGQMALDKGDDGLAAAIFRAAVKRFPRHPDVLFGLATSLAATEAERSGQLFEQILTINPHHVPTLLTKTERLIDAERYDDAVEVIGKVLAVNARHPRAWAFRAVIAHLKSDEKEETNCRKRGLETWKQNPEVDHWIGRKLSRQYRFKEGAAYQRRALEFDDTYLPAKIQLAQDLLRLGKEDEGWALADSAHKADGYDTTTFNLLNLRDELKRFRTLEDEHFILRMDRREADIYGHRVLRLLNRARETLISRYDARLDEKITVEIFPNPDDFAVRTFGMPAVSGFLGVCFGNVITANSPASQKDSPTNWESVLWHEFCHVVTLNMTHNKMPRWLSEGISVFEEKRADPTWAMPMTGQFRQWILDGEMKPVSRLTEAFMQPPTPMHMQFAYFQSSLVVEYIVEEHGVESLKNILDDLGAGVDINAALNRRTDGLDKLETGFVRFATDRANAHAPQVDWTVPEPKVLTDPARLAAFLSTNANNYAALRLAAMKLIEAKQLDRARELLNRLITIYPGDVSPGNAREALAGIYRLEQNAEKEEEVLRGLAEVSSDASAAFVRLADLAAARKDWPATIAATERLLAVSPLMKAPYRYRAEAAAHTNQPEVAIEALRALVVLEPEDPAEVHYSLARALFQTDDHEAARRHVLIALEEAPRYRDAHRLLLEIVSAAKPAPKKKEDETASDPGAGCGLKSDPRPNRHPLLR